MCIKSKAYCLIGFFCFATSFVTGQDQKIADSLINQYNSGLNSDNELIILGKIGMEETNPERKLRFVELLIAKAIKDPSFNFLYQGYLQKGNALQLKGNNAAAIKAYFKSLD